MQNLLSYSQAKNKINILLIPISLPSELELTKYTALNYCAIRKTFESTAQL